MPLIPLSAEIDKNIKVMNKPGRAANYSFTVDNEPIMALYNKAAFAHL